MKDKTIRCALHQDFGCKGEYETRKSIFGAIQRNCEKAWNEPYSIQEAEGSSGLKEIKIDLNLWPEVL